MLPSPKCEFQKSATWQFVLSVQEAENSIRGNQIEGSITPFFGTNALNAGTKFGYDKKTKIKQRSLLHMKAMEK